MSRAIALPQISIPASIGVGIGLAVVAAIALAWIANQVKEKGALGVGEWLGKTVSDAPAGLVIGIGESFGIPRTNETECDRALREGRTWDASFVCPAARFIREGLFGATPNTGGASGSW